MGPYGNDTKCNLNSKATMEKYGLNVSDLWDAQIRGLMGELSPCYTYTPEGKRGTGLDNRVNSWHLFNFSITS